MGVFDQVEPIGLIPRRNAAEGTRFLLFPQAPHVPGYAKPETVFLATPPDRILPGPEDRRVYVRDPLLPKAPYEYPNLPPFVGDVFPPAEAGPDGHFDYLDPGSRQFHAAHAFASVCRVLDIWESYLGHPIVWHFAPTYERLEIVPSLEWDNAQSGYGYLELGEDRGPDGRTYAFALNFDVIAHEIGHSILFSLFGTPDTGTGGGDYAPFHEASADLISLLSFLHFDSGLDRLLRNCKGNLLVLNELNRIAELTGDRQIRLASNSRRMSEVSNEIHDRSRPFTGAIFDTIVEEFHWRLVARGLADEDLLRITMQDVSEDALSRISYFTASEFRLRPMLFKSALTEARDNIALLLARVWPLLNADDISFEKVALVAMSAADSQLAERLQSNFHWRGIL